MCAESISELLAREAEAAERVESEHRGSYVRSRRAPKDPSQVYSLRIPLDRLELVRQLATKQRTTPAALLRSWVLERVEEEAPAEKPAAGNALSNGQRRKAIELVRQLEETLRHSAWPDHDRAVTPLDLSSPTWEEMRELMDRSARSDTWKKTGRWALDQLQTLLGDDWLGRSWRAEGRLPGELVQSSGNTFAYGFLLEWALRLRMVLERNVPGAKALRKNAARDVPKSQRLHHGLQLEVATLGLQLGEKIKLEERLPGTTNPLDVTLSYNGDQIRTEVFAVLLDELSAKAGKQDQWILRKLLKVEAAHGVTISGSLRARLSEPELAAWLTAIDLAAAAAVAGKQVQTLITECSDVVIHPPGEAAESSFECPATFAVGWRRIEDKFREKGEQTQKSGATWLRADLLDGIWFASPWAHADLPDKAASLAFHLQTALSSQEHLQGIVVSSSACPAMSGPHRDETAALDDGTIAIRRNLPFHRVRETIIVPMTQAGRANAGVWAHLYEGEPNWLDWALADASLPAVADLLQVTPEQTSPS